MLHSLERTESILRASQHSNPDLSIMICAHNEEEDLPHTLEELAESIARTRQHIEIIGVNNASDDDTANIMRQYGLKVINKSEKGLSYARQTGLEAASGKVVVVSDADNLQYAPDWPEAHMRHYPEHDVVAGRSDFDYVDPLYTALRQYKFMPRMRKVFGGKEFEEDGLLRPPSGIGTNLSYKKELALDLGYEPGTDYGEDSKMWYGLQRNGANATVDLSDEIAVLTSGRRFDTKWKVVTHVLRELRRKIRRYRTGEQNPEGEKMVDIRHKKKRKAA